MNKVYIFLIVIITIFLSGCVTKRYAWNNYDDTLYQYYKNPNEAEVFIEKLDAIIKNGEVSGTVPPGIYAEYGYTFYERGQYSDAIIYFQKEYDKWPESRSFMIKMISNAKNQNKIKDQKTSDTIPTQ